MREVSFQFYHKTQCRTIQLVSKYTLEQHSGISVRTFKESSGLLLSVQQEGVPKTIHPWDQGGVVLQGDWLERGAKGTYSGSQTLIYPWTYCKKQTIRLGCLVSQNEDQVRLKKVDH